VAGSVLGTRLLHAIPVRPLQWMFVGFILLVAARLLLVTPSREAVLPPTSSTAAVYLGIGLAMGIASGLFGIGGGIIAVPLMVSLVAISDLVAKGTSLLVSIPTSATGTVANRRAGLVELRAGVVVGVAAMVASFPAARLSLAMSPTLSARLFAGLLVLVALQLAVKAHRSGPTRR